MLIEEVNSFWILNNKYSGELVGFDVLMMVTQAITRSRAANSNGEEYNMNLPLWGLSELAIRWHDWQKCTKPLLKAVFTVFIWFLSPCFLPPPKYLLNLLKRKDRLVSSDTAVVPCSCRLLSSYLLSSSSTLYCRRCHFLLLLNFVPLPPPPGATWLPP